MSLHLAHGDFWYFLWFTWGKILLHSIFIPAFSFLYTRCCPEHPWASTASQTFHVDMSPHFIYEILEMYWFLVKLTWYVSALRSGEWVLRLQGEFTALKPHTTSSLSRLLMLIDSRWLLYPGQHLTSLPCDRMRQDVGNILFLLIFSLGKWSLLWRRIWRPRRIRCCKNGSYQCRLGSL